jgi:hypothetical protein
MANVERAAGTMLSDSLAGERLVYTNAGGGDFRYEPGRVTIALDATALRARYPEAQSARLVPPEGWRVAAGAERREVGADGTIAWQLVPGGVPATCEQGIAIGVGGGGLRLGTLRHVIPIEIRAETQFDPERHTLPFHNSTSDFGPVEPRADLFGRTYRRGGVVLGDAFFKGLYRDIVFLTAETDARGSGGLCTGMARFALERSLRGVTGGAKLADEQGRSGAMEEVQAWHGRQLTDRALLAAARQFFDPSPSVAFYRFRDQVVTTGRGEVAFDVGIARWEPSPAKWGAMLRHLVSVGHTVTPYAFRQMSDGMAEVSVYDPSHPDRADWPENIARFDLITDRYAYRGFGSLERDDPTTVLAVPQGNFEAPGTAYAASIANLALHPELLVEEWRENGALRRNAAVAGGVLAASVALLRRRARE